MSLSVKRALEVLSELRERGDVRAPELGKRKLKAAELEELAQLTPPLATVAGKGQEKVFGISGYGQRFLQEKEAPDA